MQMLWEPSAIIIKENAHKKSDRSDSARAGVGQENDAEIQWPKNWG